MFRQFIGLIVAISLSACVVEKHSATTVNLQKAAALNAEIALIYLKQGQILLAKQKIFLARQQAPDSIAVLLAVAAYQQQLGDLQQAQQTYHKLLILAPKNPEVLNNYAVFLCQQGNFAVAQQYLQQLFHASNPRIVEQARINAKNCKTAFVHR